MLIQKIKNIFRKGAIRKKRIFIPGNDEKDNIKAGKTTILYQHTNTNNFTAAANTSASEWWIN